MSGRGVLYFGDWDESPIIGKFNSSDPVQFDPASDSTLMWPDVEEVKDDGEEDRPDKKEGSEYWNRRNRRRFLRRVNGKKKLYIQDTKKKSAAPGQVASQMSYEGSMITHSNEGSQAASKYVLLQMLKPDDPRADFVPQAEHQAAGGGAIVKIIPVGDWYSFQKPSIMRSDKSLKEIEADFLVQERRNKAKLQRLKKIQDGTDLEDQATLRRKAETKLKLESMKAPSIFGGLKYRKGGVLKKPTGFKGHLLDDGTEADIDEGGGGEHYEEDNDTEFTLWDKGQDADNEEEYVDLNQAMDNEIEELEAARMNSPLNDDDDDYVDSDTENEDEGDDQDEDMKKRTKKDSSQYGQGSEFSIAASQLGSALRKKQSSFASVDSGAGSGSDSGSEGGDGSGNAPDSTNDGTQNISRRRSYEEMSNSGDEELPRVDSFSNDVVGGEKKRAKTEKIFSEENVKALIYSKEKGRIKAKELLEVFKKDAKRQYGDTYKDV